MRKACWVNTSAQLIPTIQHVSENCYYCCHRYEQLHRNRLRTSFLRVVLIGYRSTKCCAICSNRVDYFFIFLFLINHHLLQIYVRLFEDKKFGSNIYDRGVKHSKKDVRDFFDFSDFFDYFFYCFVLIFFFPQSVRDFFNALPLVYDVYF